MGASPRQNIENEMPRHMPSTSPKISCSVMYFVKFTSRFIRRTPFVPSPVQISYNSEGGGWRSKTHWFQIVVLAELVIALTSLKSGHRVICRLSLLWSVLIPSSKFFSLDLRFSSLLEIKQHFALANSI